MLQRLLLKCFGTGKDGTPGWDKQIIVTVRASSTAPCAALSNTGSVSNNRISSRRGNVGERLSQITDSIGAGADKGHARMVVGGSGIATVAVA